MFSDRARDAMRRRRGAAGLGVFVRETVRDARDAYRRNRRVADAAARRAGGMGLVAAVAAGVALGLADGVADGVRLAAWTIAGALATAGLAVTNARLFRAVGSADEVPGSAAPVLAAPGLPNALTLLRFVLIAPLVVLAGTHRAGAAAAVYVVLGLTDVADGVLARRRGPVSEFGVVMDPLADVASTWALFTVFVVDHRVPEWLYLLLTARYAMLLVGSAALFLATGPIEFRATIPGKVVGVAQATGALLILWGGLEPVAERVLFAFLGLGFASIVVSQALLGWKQIRRASRGRTSRRGPSR
jgi:cardiolipin synthase